MELDPGSIGSHSISDTPCPQEDGAVRGIQVTYASSLRQFGNIACNFVCFVKPRITLRSYWTVVREDPNALVHRKGAKCR